MKKKFKLLLERDVLTNRGKHKSETFWVVLFSTDLASAEEQAKYEYPGTRMSMGWYVV